MNHHPNSPTVRVREPDAFYKAAGVTMSATVATILFILAFTATTNSTIMSVSIGTLAVANAAVAVMAATMTGRDDQTLANVVAAAILGVIATICFSVTLITDWNGPYVLAAAFLAVQFSAALRTLRDQ